MTIQAAETTVRASIVVDAPIDRAFQVFTNEFGSFKPPDHTLLEHRHLDRHGEGWQGVRAGVGREEGWPLYLDRCARWFSPGGRGGAGSERPRRLRARPARR